MIVRDVFCVSFQPSYLAQVLWWLLHDRQISQVWAKHLIILVNRFESSGELLGVCMVVTMGLLLVEIHLCFRKTTFRKHKLIR